jgi:uncharacterized membrane protein YeiH
MTLLAFLDFASVFVFALTGGLVASRAQLDIVGFVFVAGLTAIGGGTTRDLILGRAEVFWVAEPIYLSIICLAAILTFFGAHLIHRRYHLLVWLDAVALCIAVSAGMLTARGLGAQWPIEIVMGVMTGCLGGLMRDVVCNEVPLVLKQGELYVTAALSGAVTSIVLISLGGTEEFATAACVAMTFAMRAGAIALGWRLPIYKHVPPRNKLK